MLGALLARILREQEVKADAMWVTGPVGGPEHPPTRAVPARWAAALADVSSAGPLHAHEVQIALETILGAAADEDRRRLLVLVDLLRRLAVEADTAVADAGARRWLATLPPRSKTGRAAREALAVGGA